MEKHIWRFFTTETLGTGRVLTLDSDEHHLGLHVLRLKANDVVEICDGRGNVAKARVTVCDKKKLEIIVSDFTTTPLPSYEVHLFLAMPKPSTLDEVVAMATELGVRGIHIFTSEKVATRGEPRLEKLRKQAFSALRINKQPWLPAITVHTTLQQLLVNVPQMNAYCLCDEAPIHAHARNTHSHLLPRLLEQKFSGNKLGVFIGPEASFTEAERNFILKLPNACAVSLGDAILTVPVASQAAITLALSYPTLQKYFSETPSVL